MPSIFRLHGLYMEFIVHFDAQTTEVIGIEWSNDRRPQWRDLLEIFRTRCYETKLIAPTCCCPSIFLFQYIHIIIFLYATPDVLTRTEDKAKRVLHVKTPQSVRFKKGKFYVHFQCNKQVSFLQCFHLLHILHFHFIAPRLPKKRDKNRMYFKKNIFMSRDLHSRRFLSASVVQATKKKYNNRD